MTNYVPILKAKQGELMALRNLEPDVARVIVPFFELQKRETTRSMNMFLKQFIQSWGISLPFFLDVDPNFLRSSPDEATVLFNQVIAFLRAKRFKPIPVSGLTRPATWNEAIINAVQADDQGVCLRLDGNDWSNINQLSARVNALLSQLNVGVAKADIVLDFGAFSPGQSGIITASAITAINSFSNVMEFRSITVSGTSFPQSILPSPYVMYQLPRAEWQVWNSLASIRLPRTPNFGDYTTVNPNFPDIEFHFAIAPKTKYAIDNDWLAVRSEKGGSYNRVCQMLTANAEYRGSGFSWGDKRISDYLAIPTCRVSPTESTAIGINHHLTLAARQVANYRATSGPGGHIL